MARYRLKIPCRLKIVVSGLLMVAMCTAAPVCWGQSAAEQQKRRYIEGLCDRELFTLAERYCSDRLADNSLDQRWKSFYAIELSRVLVQHALSSPSSEAALLWQQALEVLEPWFEAPSPSTALLARAQAALVQLAHGEASTTIPTAPQTQSPALAPLRDAARRFEQVGQDALAQARSPQAVAIDGLRPDELRSLANRSRCHQAQAYRLIAATYAPGTPDRADALNRAVELLEPLADLPPEQPLSWESRLGLIASLRLQEDRDAAARRLRELGAAGPPPEVQLRARAEAIQLALDSNSLDAALRLARQGRQLEGQVSPELDLARLQAVLASLRAQDRSAHSARVSELQDEAQTIVETIREAHGGAWLNRAQQKMADMIGDVARISDVALLEQAAATHFRAGEIDAALSAYERASRQAQQQGDDASAFRLGFLAATLEHQRKNFGQASKRYQQLALKYPALSDAPQAHLLAAHNCWEQLRAEQSSDFAPYVTLLRDHLRQWPDNPSVHEVYWRLGRVAELQQDWPLAVESYRAVPIEHPHAADAVRSLLRSYGNLLDASDPPTAQRLARDAARHLQEVAQRSTAEPFARVRFEATLAAAEMWTAASPNGNSPARSLLEQYVADSRVPAEFRRQAADELLLLRIEEIDALQLADELSQLGDISPARVYRVAQALMRQPHADEPPTRRRRAEIVSELLSRQPDRLAELAPDQQRQALLWQAQAVAELDQVDQATVIYQRILQKWPGDSAAVRSLATLLTVDDRADHRQQAFELWRKFEQLAAKGSADWLEARYQIARLYHLLGNDEQARKILHMTRLLHPDAADAALQARVEALEAQLAPNPTSD